MKLLELEIQNIRGIRELRITPNGNNFVVWGPNGSGKSAVVDSLDFLLTGEITRLTGRGTRGISLRNHGPHIDCEPEDAWVRGLIQFSNVEEPIELRRSLGAPGLIEYDEKFSEQINETLEIARRGQHVLTRRDILRYITAESSTRARDIQELLNITEIENIRSAFRRAANSLEKEMDAGEQVVETAKGRINATAQIEEYEDEKILEFINVNRKVLSGEPLTDFQSLTIKKKLTPPVVKQATSSLNLPMLDRDIENLRKYTDEIIREEIARNEKALRKILDTIQKEPNILRDLARIELFDLGLKMIDETQSCPLCDTDWPPAELQVYLNGKLKKAQEARELKERITKISLAITRNTNIILPSLVQIIASADNLDEEEIMKELRLWYEKLNGYSSSLASPIETYLPERYKKEEIESLFRPPEIMTKITLIQKKAHDEFPKTTPEQDAWDTLTRLEENVKALEEAQKQYRVAELNYDRAALLYSTFVESRDRILQNTYDEVRDRFVNIYRHLHGSDESSFGALISPQIFFLMRAMRELVT